MTAMSDSQPPADPGPQTPAESGPAQPSVESADPRAAAQHVGVLFQTAGLILAFGSCCIGSLVGLAQRPEYAALDMRTPVTVVGAWSAIPTHKKLATISMFASCAAGLGVLAAGIGLQSDRHGSARLGLLVTVPPALFHLLYLGYLLIYGPWRWWLPAPLLYTVVWCLLALLAIVAAGAHAKHPPSREIEVIDDERGLPKTMGEAMLRQFERERKRDRGRR